MQSSDPAPLAVKALPIRLWPRNLWSQLAVLVTLSLVVTSFGYVIYSVNYISEHLAQSAKKEVSALVRNTALASAGPVLLNDFATVEDLLIRMAEYPGIQRIEIVLTNGQSIGRVVRGHDGRVYRDYALNPPKVLASGNAMLSLSYPIVAGTQLGTVYIDHSLDALTDLQREIRGDTFIAAGFAILLTIGLLLLFFRAPARALAEATAFAGTLDTEAGRALVVSHSSVEFEKLGESLNRASMRLFDQQQQVLKLASDRVQTILQHTAEAIVTTDERGTVSSFNYAAERIFDYQASQILGQSLTALLPADLLGAQVESAPGSRQSAVAYPDIVGKRRDGSYFSAEASVSLASENGKRYFTVFLRDISARKAAEESIRNRNRELVDLNRALQETQNQLLQSERMAAIGQLAAGVAHEINNPIGYVYSNLGTLQRYVEELFKIVDDYDLFLSQMAEPEALARWRLASQRSDLAYFKKDVPSLMRESKEGITRVKKIVRDLQDFSRIDGPEDWHWASLSKGLDSTLNMIKSEIKLKADVVINYEAVPEVQCLGSQINQVFMNLLMNAAQAIEGRGVIVIATRQVGDEVWVEISDNGKGIPPENTKRIFDPFFTTKPIGKGTGLGLSLSYGIIKKHNGRIEVQSEVGQGTTFRVCLPIRQALGV